MLDGKLVDFPKVMSRSDGRLLKITIQMVFRYYAARIWLHGMGGCIVKNDRGKKLEVGLVEAMEALLPGKNAVFGSYRTFHGW